MFKMLTYWYILLCIHLFSKYFTEIYLKYKILIYKMCSKINNMWLKCCHSTLYIIQYIIRTPFSPLYSSMNRVWWLGCCAYYIVRKYIGMDRDLTGTLVPASLSKMGVHNVRFANNIYSTPFL